MLNKLRLIGLGLLIPEIALRGAAGGPLFLINSTTLTADQTTWTADIYYVP